MKEPNEPIEEEQEETSVENTEAKDVAEQLPGYQDYLKEIQGNRLTYGDY